MLQRLLLARVELALEVVEGDLVLPRLLRLLVVLLEHLVDRLLVRRGRVLRHIARRLVSASALDRWPTRKLRLQAVDWQVLHLERRMLIEFAASLLRVAHDGRAIEDGLVVWVITLQDTSGLLVKGRRPANAICV